ncbi:MAG: SLC13 family permease [Verrucomicrobiales bacterium]
MVEVIIVLSLLVVVTVIFATEWIPVDIVTLLLLLTLLTTGILTADEAFAGFGSDILIMLASVFVLSGAMRETGVVDQIGSTLARVSAGRSENVILTVLMSSVAALSSVMNNTTVTALMLGPVTGLARQGNISPSKLLMPLSFAAILGGTCTVIGTSTNVAVSGYLDKMGERGIGFFEMTPLGVILVLVGIGSMLLFGKRLLPSHAEAESLAEGYGLQKYLSEVIIQEDSPWVGKRLSKCDFEELDMRILSVFRDGAKLVAEGKTVLRSGDTLMVRADVESLMKVRETKGIEILPDAKFGDGALRADDHEILEVFITPLSGLRDRTLREVDLTARGVTVLAINRHGRHLRRALRDVRMMMGDLLLVQGSPENMASFRNSPDVAVYGELNPGLHRGKKGMIVLGAMLGGVIASATGIMPLSGGLLAAAVASVLLRTIPAHRVYQVIEWRLLILIAGMMALGTAMDKTGAADLLANGVVQVFDFGGTWMILAAFVILTVLLTQPMSNAAAALVILPVAFSTAEQLGANGRSFAIAIAFSASVSLIAPFEPSSLLVYGVGKYRVADFLRVGGSITLILILLIVVLVPVFWPLLPAS